MRLDIYVSEAKKITRNQAQLLIKKELVNIDGKIIKKNGFEIFGNEKIKIGELPMQVFNAIPNKMSLDIIYEDNDILVINKDQGRQVYPGDEKDMENTLLSGLRYYYLVGDGRLSVEHIGFVHRIDKETTGILMTTKNKIALNYYQNEFRLRQVKKIYLAVVHGKVSINGKVIAPIARSKMDRKKMSVSLSGRDSESHFDIINYFDECDVSLLKVNILTGRTHQIRVHMSSIGYPVVGDVVYGNPKKDESICKKYGTSGLMLHSYCLEIKKMNQDGFHKFNASLKGGFNKLLNCLNFSIQSLLLDL